MNKKTTLFSLVLFLSTALLIPFSTVAEALIMPNPHAAIIKEFKGKLYQMSYSEWRDVEIVADLDGREVKPKNWFKIIESGKPNEANALIYALSQFLTKDELWPYVETGLMRKNQTNIPLNDNVANHAYRWWSYAQKGVNLLAIRTNPLYQKNLTPSVNWSVLFEHPSREKLSLNHATTLLQNKITIDSDYQQKRQRYAAINRIATHKNTEDLKLLMKDENFEIALGSWVALAKIMPKQVASDIVNHALWLQDEIEYDYSTGCFGHTGHLVPVIAAMTLFSDYLSVDQVRQVLNELPEMWNQDKFKGLNVNHPHIKPVILEMRKKNIDFNHFKYRLKNPEKYEKIHQLKKSTDPIENFNQAMLYVSVIGLDDKLNDFLLKILNDPENEYTASNKNRNELNRYFSYALNNPDNISKHFIKQVIKSSFFNENKDLMVEYLLKNKGIWPKNWKALKQQIITQLASEITEESRVPITVKLAID